MSTAVEAAPERSSAYDLFILVLTVLSLVIMVFLVLPLDQATLRLLNGYDNVICLVFLFDFFYNLSRAKPKRAYFIDRRGWLDLLGSVPSFGFFRYTALLRLARLSRLARITRLMRRSGKGALAKDVVKHRGQYALSITALTAMIVLVVTSAMVLQFESHSPDANITSGGDALWWGVVTITTVGYGDEFPVTIAGRLTAFFLMLAGVGIIGALASILSSVLVTSPEADEGGEAPAADALRRELLEIKAELAALRRSLASGPRGLP